MVDAADERSFNAKVSNIKCNGSGLLFYINAFVIVAFVEISYK